MRQCGVIRSNRLFFNMPESKLVIPPASFAPYGRPSHRRHSPLHAPRATALRPATAAKKPSRSSSPSPSFLSSPPLPPSISIFLIARLAGNELEMVNSSPLSLDPASPTSDPACGGRTGDGLRACLRPVVMLAYNGSGWAASAAWRKESAARWDPGAR